MLLRLIRSIKCFVAVVGLFFCSGVVIADTVADVGSVAGFMVTIDGVCYTEDELTKDIEWTVELIAGSPGGLLGDTLGPAQEFKYETVVMVNGIETLVIPGGTWSTDMGLSAAWYTAKIPLKKLGVLNLDITFGKYYLTAFTRNYRNGIDINYSQVRVGVEVEVELKFPELRCLMIKGVDMPSNMVAVTSITNFLVAGNTITAEAEVLNYHEKYFDLKSAKLIGTPKGGPAMRKHECLEIHCDVKTTEHFAKSIEINHSLEAQDGFHGNYEWKVEAEFLCKINGNTYSRTSSTTNAPVFFKKYGEDQAGIPNWFTYWGKDGACPNLRICQDANEVVYNPNQSYTYAGWNPNDNKVHLSKKSELNIEGDASGGKGRLYEVGPAGFHYPKPIVVTNKNNPALSFSFGGLSVYGINTVEEVLAHELFHKQSVNFYNDYDASSDSASKLGFRLKDDDKDDSRPPINGHKICDFLFNCQEEELRYYELDTQHQDTYTLKNKSAEYEAFGDNEFVAMVMGAGAKGLAVAEKDWAYPGHQSCLPEMYNGFINVKHTNKTPFDIIQTRQNTKYEANVKENGINISLELSEDKKVATINCAVALDCVDKRNKYLQGIVKDRDGNVVYSTIKDILPDNSVVVLKIDGRKIYESDKNGPYELTQLSLMEFDGSELYERCSIGNYSNIVINIERKDFLCGNAYLLEIAGETVSTNGIEVAINTEVNTVGKYEIFATLGSTNGMPVAMCRKAMDCSVGTNCFKVVFAASDILKSGVDGPYNIDNLALFKDGVRIDSRLDYSILSKNYRADAFDFEEGEEIDSDQFMSQFEDYTPPPKLPPTKTYWVIFNSNGGTTSETIREVKSGDEIGELPIPEFGNNEFLGWYTELEGGSRISNATIITTNVLYHAHWKEVLDEVAFISTAVTTKEGDGVDITIGGGAEDSASSVQLYGVYNTAAAADLDLAKTLVDGKPVKSFKFPYTLTWKKGEYVNRTITFFTKTDKIVEGNEIFTLQLANPVGVALGENGVCAVNIEDLNSYAVLQDGIMNPNIKVSTKGDGKWIVGEGSNSDESGLLGLYHAESPSLLQGKSSTLSFGAVKGEGVFTFYVRFTGDPDEEIPSTLSIYSGKDLVRGGILNHTQVTNEWKGFEITVSGNASSSSNFNFVFTQGSDPNTHVEISDISWDNGSSKPVYDVYAWQDGSEGGYVSGSGPYLEGKTAKIVAKPLPGWVFDGWYEVTLNKETDDLEYELFNEKATVSFKPTRDIYLRAFFKKIPYVRGLADPVDGGKVTGSGICAKGKKVTLKAAANKNFMFKGWYASRVDNQNIIDESSCVATTASLVIDRLARPTANSKASTTITNVVGDVTYFAVFEGHPRVTVSIDPAHEAGKITGEGRYAPGKKVTVKATTNKGYVFKGWYKRGECLTQALSYVFTVPNEDVALTAKFVTQNEDAESIALSIDALGGEINPEVATSATNICGVALKWSVAAEALSQPVVAVSGLPAGLKFTAKDIMKTGSKTEVAVPANTIYGAPTAESKLDVKTGLRKPTAVKFTVTTAGKSTRVFFVNMTILPLPDWTVGTFNGGGDNGQVSLTVAKTGKLSGKYLTEGLTWALAANSFDSIDDSGDVYRATLIGKSGKMMITNEVAVTSDAMGGIAESFDYIAYQDNWKLEPWKTLGKFFAKSVVLEYEDSASVAGVESPGVLSLKFAASGAVTVKGAFVTGIDEKTGMEIFYSTSGTAVLAPQSEPDEDGVFDGVVFVYLAPKARKFDGYVRCVNVRWTGEGWVIENY